MVKNSLHVLFSLLLLGSVSSFLPRYIGRLFACPMDSGSVHNSNGQKGANTIAAVLCLATLLNSNVPAFSVARAESSQEVAFNEQERIRLQSKPRERILLTEGIKVPYNHENFPVNRYLGKATLVVNMKLDDPQTATQYPALTEIYNKYSKDGLNVLVFPTEQGYYEPDDDEMCRAKSKEYYGFGDYPKAVVFDKVDVLGPSANPFYTYLTNNLATPNGYTRITLNYEKFLLDSSGNPVRRYPRKVTPTFSSSSSSSSTTTTASLSSFSSSSFSSSSSSSSYSSSSSASYSYHYYYYFLLSPMSTT